MVESGFSLVNSILRKHVADLSGKSAKKIDITHKLIITMINLR